MYKLSNVLAEGNRVLDRSTKCAGIFFAYIPNKGKIKRITPGAVNTEVIIELPGGAEIVSVITKRSAEQMALTSGP